MHQHPAHAGALGAAAQPANLVNGVGVTTGETERPCRREHSPAPGLRLSSLPCTGDFLRLPASIQGSERSCPASLLVLKGLSAVVSTEVHGKRKGIKQRHIGVLQASQMVHSKCILTYITQPTFKEDFRDIALKGQY